SMPTVSGKASKGSNDAVSDNTVDDALSTLARCLNIASTSSDAPIPTAVEESSWPHDHHTLSDDAPPMAAGDRRNNIRIVQYQDESQIGDVMRLITKDLSEPYSIYTYRYFIHNWPQFCLLAQDTTTDQFVGVIVCKMERTPSLNKMRGYIAMLAVDEAYRKMGVGQIDLPSHLKFLERSKLVQSVRDSLGWQTPAIDSLNIMFPSMVVSRVCYLQRWSSSPPLNQHDRVRDDSTRSPVVLWKRRK
ncbi:hypothetical protein PMAYCL1PPCAC_30411, partial [Pristionchus mayeri]